MSKKILLVTTKQTCSIEMPDKLFTLWSIFAKINLIKWKIYKTESGIREAKAELIILDELVEK